MKRGLVYIGGPKQLKDFIWYYLYKGKEYKWTLICQPMFPEMKLKEVCERTKIFDEIIQVKPYVTKTFFEKMFISVQMFFFWIIGKNKKYALKEINKITDLGGYDLVCSPTTRGVTPGLLVLASDNVTVDLLEDAIGECTDDNAKFEIKRLLEKDYFVAYSFAKMGYFNLHNYFPNRSTMKCNRYSEMPEKISGEHFKKIYRLNDMSMIDLDKYNEIIDRTFGTSACLDGVEAVLFTTPLGGFSPKYQECNEQVIDFLFQKGYKKIAIKKHPRDVKKYSAENLEVIEIDPMIPAENILDKIVNKSLYFMYPSAVLQNIKERENVKVLRFKVLLDCSAYVSGFKKSCSLCNIDEETIIDL